MTSLFSYFITFSAVVFWVFRTIVTLTTSMEISIGIEPINMNIEIIVLFVTLFSFIFIIKRNIFGALVYFVTYGLYFGTHIYNSLVNVQGSVDYLSLCISIIGVTIATVTLLDVLINKNRSVGVGDKKTDWFYKKGQYERKLDTRVDKNQYKF